MSGLLLSWICHLCLTMDVSWAIMPFVGVFISDLSSVLDESDLVRLFGTLGGWAAGSFPITVTAGAARGVGCHTYPTLTGQQKNQGAVIFFSLPLGLESLD